MYGHSYFNVASHFALVFVLSVKWPVIRKCNNIFAMRNEFWSCNCNNAIQFRPLARPRGTSPRGRRAVDCWRCGRKFPGSGSLASLLAKVMTPLNAETASTSAECAAPSGRMPAAAGEHWAILRCIGARWAEWMCSICGGGGLWRAGEGGAHDPRVPRSQSSSEKMFIRVRVLLLWVLSLMFYWQPLLVKTY
jgi:hypothetical protein